MLSNPVSLSSKTPWLWLSEAEAMAAMAATRVKMGSRIWPLMLVESEEGVGMVRAVVRRLTTLAGG